jgi:hypothetical protein
MSRDTIIPIDRAKDMVMDLGWRRSMSMCYEFLWSNENTKSVIYWKKVINCIADMVDDRLSKKNNEHE